MTDSAAAGRFAMVVVPGEPGVGKTALVGLVADRVADRMTVASGACLPLTSLSVPFLPLVSAVRAWTSAHAAPPTDLRPLNGDSAAVVEAFDTWLDRRCSERPTLLVIDDLQWADQSTLDVLTYVLAGPADRRLAVLLTVRSTDLPAGHRLRRWLADAERMPRFSTLRLEPLDRLGTAQQIAELLGGPVRESLVDEVFAHAGGNAYLTRLLVARTPLDATSLPSTLPATLHEAVLGPWHAMSAPARELTQLLAVGGPHLRSDQIARVAQPWIGSGAVVGLLREAVDAGLLEVQDDSSYWFHHPVQAEVLAASSLPEQRRTWHAAYAALLAPTVGGSSLDGATVDGVATAVAVADHYAQTDDVEQAFGWAMRAARAAGAAGGAAEELRLLHRALGLLPRARQVSESRVGLLERIQRAAERSGRQDEELAAVDALLAEAEVRSSPLDTAALLVRRMDLRLSTGQEFAGLGDVREAVRLSAAAPGSWQHAIALAELAHAELWHGDAAGPAHAAAAVAAARASGDPKSLAYALTARSMAMTIGGRPGGEIPAEEAVSAAVSAGDFWAFCHAALWAGNALDTWSSRAFVDYVHARREQLVALGAPHTYVAFLCAMNANGHLWLGDWRECVADLRVVLGATPGPMGEVSGRLTAALLAALQGRAREAEAHLHRAEELFAETSGYLGFEFDVVRAEVALASGDPARALAAALTGARGPGLPPNQCERLLPLAARALADQAVRRRDERRSDSEALRRIDDLRSEFPRVIADLGTAGPVYRLQLEAMQALYDAEILRARGEPGSGDAWAAAADACAACHLPWAQAYALRHAADVLVADRARRGEGAALLREAHLLATDLGAEPLVHHLEGLARIARIAIDRPDANAGSRADGPDAPPPAQPPAVSGLTPRENEVLALVVAGRTYAEIARSLYISEKTVSSHISNLLRKTGTANRIALAGLVERSDTT